jgi:hypothetical protein
LIVDGGTGTPSDQYVVFSSPLANPAAVVSFINNWHPTLAGVASLDINNHLVLSANSIQIDEGNANTLLGYTTGQFAEVGEPEVDTEYTAYYTSDKLASEYKPGLFTDVNDIVTTYGSKQAQTIIATGTASTAASRTLTDATKAWVVNDLVGCYVKILSGTGKGQVRVIISNTANTVTTSQAWTTLMTPDSTSTYKITDINENSISMGTQIAVDTGATAIIASQYADDIFNDTNIKLAITNLESDTDGYRPYCLTLMRGLASTETDPINYLKAFVNEQSDVLHNRWMMTTTGMAQGNTSYKTYIAMATSMASERMALVNIDSIGRDFGTGTVTLDGSYVAAALNGLICASESAGEPMTARSLAKAFAVSTYSDPYNMLEKKLMAAAGVAIVERQGTDLVLVDDLTTNQTTIKSKYIRFTRMADFVSDFLKTRLASLTKGQRFVTSSTGSDDLLSATRGNLNFLFNVLKNPQDQIVTAVEDLSVTKNGSDPTQMDITANIYLTPECKYVFALLGFGVR